MKINDIIIITDAFYNREHATITDNSFITDNLADFVVITEKSLHF